MRSRAAARDADRAWDADGAALLGGTGGGAAGRSAWGGEAGPAAAAEPEEGAPESGGCCADCLVCGVPLLVCLPKWMRFVLRAAPADAGSVVETHEAAPLVAFAEDLPWGEHGAHGAHGHVAEAQRVAFAGADAAGTAAEGDRGLGDSVDPDLLLRVSDFRSKRQYFKAIAARSRVQELIDRQDRIVEAFGAVRQRRDAAEAAAEAAAFDPFA